MILMGLSIFCSDSFAEKGFSIEGGMIYDHPANSSGNRPYNAMKGGFGFTGNIGYDMFERVGLELGVTHTTHAFEIGVQNGVVLEDNAEKTTFFLKARYTALKREKFEIVPAAGIGFFDITGLQLHQQITVNNDFSGLGVTGSIDFRYYITPGLAASFYLGGNIVNYTRFEIDGFKSSFGRSMPGGSSFNWGLMLYHHIGIPQI
jgi:hypothetical protein